MLSYRIKFDEDYAVERSYRVHFEKDAGFSFAKFRICMLFFFAATVPLCAWLGREDAAIGGALAGLGMAFLPKTQRWEFRRRLAKSPIYGQQLSFELSEDGFRMTEPSSDRVDWAAFTRAVRVGDGFILMTPTTSWWLPDAQLSGGSVDEAANILRRKVGVYDG